MSLCQNAEKALERHNVFHDTVDIFLSTQNVAVAGNVIFSRVRFGLTSVPFLSSPLALGTSSLRNQLPPPPFFEDRRGGVGSVSLSRLSLKTQGRRCSILLDWISELNLGFACAISLQPLCDLLRFVNNSSKTVILELRNDDPNYGMVTALPMRCCQKQLSEVIVFKRAVCRVRVDTTMS